MAQVVESLSHKRQGRVDPGVNTMAADDLAMQGARASAAMVLTSLTQNILISPLEESSNGSWCIGIKGEMSGTVCVTFTWDIYTYIYDLFIAFVCFVVCSLL